MIPGLYIINYHNVDWKDTFYSRAIGGTVRPDVFRAQLAAYSSLGSLVSLDEALARLATGRRYTKPTFSLWFDDGYAGVRKHAFPICREFGVRAGLSINSRFVQQKELFWRCKLSYLAMTDGLRFLRSRLRRICPSVPLRLRHWLLENFSEAILGAINETYQRFASEAVQRDALRLFDTASGLKTLMDAGWTITNHSAAHYPLTPALGWPTVEKQFGECDDFLRDIIGARQYWVVPFDVGTDTYLKHLTERAITVRVGNRVNTPDTLAGRVIYRHVSPCERRVRSFLNSATVKEMPEHRSALNDAGSPDAQPAMR